MDHEVELPVKFASMHESPSLKRARSPTRPTSPVPEPLYKRHKGIVDRPAAFEPKHLTEKEILLGDLSDLVSPRILIILNVRIHVNGVNQVVNRRL